MSNSQFCIQQRQKEQQQLKKLLVFGFASSAILHGILAHTLPRWSFETPDKAEKPMEITIVQKPKSKPKVESKPIVKPKPYAKRYPLGKPVKQPEPVKAQTAPPKPAPKKVLTTPTPAPNRPIVSAPITDTAQPSSLSSNFAAPSSSSVSSAESSNSSIGVPGLAVATNSAPPRPESNSEPSEGISCVNNCEPEYPASLEGTEGSAGVKLTLDSKGNVIGAELASADSSSQVNRQALLAARQMQFSSPGDSATSVRVKIDFTVEGSEYDRARREEQAKREQAERERQQEAAARQQQLEAAARQQQLEAEQRARQEQLELQRQARQEQLQQQQQEPAPSTTPQAEPAPKPLPTLSTEELDEERLRKFKERMEQYREK